MRDMRADRMSQSLVLAAILAMVGGFTDAYTVLCRGGVFANAETGNIALLGVSLAQQDFAGALTYLAPILAYAAGITTSNLLSRKWGAELPLHWRQIIVLLEATVLMGVAFVPSGNGYNTLVAVLISFVCSLQVESFRNTRGHNIVTTMFTGNLRNGTVNLLTAIMDGNKDAIKVSLKYFTYIGFFMLGAVCGGAAIHFLGTHATLVACVGLTIVFAMMFLTPKDLAESPKENCKNQKKSGLITTKI